MGVLQGEYLSTRIKRTKITHDNGFNGTAVYVKDSNNLPVVKFSGGLTLTLPGPNAAGLEAMREVWSKEIVEIGDEAKVLSRLNADHKYKDVEDDLLGD